MFYDRVLHHWSYSRIRENMHNFSFRVCLCIDEDYERIVVMKYEKELEAKFGKSRYAWKFYSFKIFFWDLPFYISLNCTCWTGGRREGSPPLPHLGGETGFWSLPPGIARLKMAPFWFPSPLRYRFLVFTGLLSKMRRHLLVFPAFF